MQYNQDGTYKRTMKSDRAHNTIGKTAQSSSRPQGARPARGFEWDIMDTANRRSMEGFATTVSAMTDLTQAGFQQWVNLGVFRRIAEELVQDLYERVCMPGFKTSGVWFCAGNTVLATSWVSCNYTPPVILRWILMIQPLHSR